jgi:hypothetical protein
LRFWAKGVTLDEAAIVAVFMGVLSLGCCRCFSCHAWHVPTCRTPPGEGAGSKRKGLRAELFGGTARSVGEPKPRGRMALQRARGDPLAGLSTLLGAERRNYWGGRCGKERTAGMGSARRQSWLERGKVLLPYKRYSLRVQVGMVNASSKAKSCCHLSAYRDNPTIRNVVIA